MRLDEGGNSCPATLGEYHGLVNALAPDSRAAQFLQQKIDTDPDGVDAQVMAADSQMRALLMPMMLQPATTDD